jgi:hypothetical protein
MRLWEQRYCDEKANLWDGKSGRGFNGGNANETKVGKEHHF